MKKRIIVFMLSLSFAWIFGCARDSLQYVSVENQDIEKMKEESSFYETTLEECIQVHICGEVYFPGVYTLFSGSRIHEVVKMAGGFTKEADTRAVNLAKELTDGEQVYIPSITESQSDSTGLININRADEEMLCTIPGIGSVRAKQIIEYRDTYGNFKSIEDIMNVSGIKEGTFEKIAPYITVL